MQFLTTFQFSLVVVILKEEKYVIPVRLISAYFLLQIKQKKTIGTLKCFYLNYDDDDYDLIDKYTSD